MSRADFRCRDAPLLASAQNSIRSLATRIWPAASNQVSTDRRVIIRRILPGEDDELIVPPRVPARHHGVDASADIGRGLSLETPQVMAAATGGERAAQALDPAGQLPSHGASP